MQSRHQRIPPKAAHGQRAGMGILGRGNSRSKAKGHERFAGGWGGAGGASCSQQLECTL